MVGAYATPATGPAGHTGYLRSRVRDNWGMGRNRDRFRDRADAGRQLAGLLRAYRNSPDAVVLGLLRGGVPVAAETASTLGLPLDVLVVRKLGVPGYEEVAFGAIASGGIASSIRMSCEALASPNPQTYRLSLRTQLLSDRIDRLALRRVLALMIKDHAHRTLTHLVGILPSMLFSTSHSSILSRSEPRRNPRRFS